VTSRSQNRGRPPNAGRPRETKLDALANILRLEQGKGFPDKTVAGGLDRFLERWADELRPVLGDMGSYSKLDTDRRRAWTERMLAALKEAPAQPRAQAARPAKPLPKQSERVTRSGNGKAPPPTRKPSRLAKATPKTGGALHLDDGIEKLFSMRGDHAGKLRKMGIRTVRDLIYHFPFRYIDFSHVRKVADLEYGKEQTVLVSVWEATETRIGKDFKRTSTQAVVGDESGNIHVTWFGQGFRAKSLSPGTRVVLNGKVTAFLNQLRFESPEFIVLRSKQEEEELLRSGRLDPVYPLTEGLTIGWLRNYIRSALKAAIHEVGEFLPDDVRHREGLMGVQDAVSQMHHPNTQADANMARRRLAFDEFLLMQLAMLKRRKEWKEEHAGVALAYDRAMVDGFLKSLPFPLTGAQHRAKGEILRDVSTDRPMSRMLQGDVGSGKTVVALAALLAAVSAGYQGALMAPTEVLAEQHYLTIGRLLRGTGKDVEVKIPSGKAWVLAIGPEGAAHGEPVLKITASWMSGPITLGLLIGSLPAKAKREVQQRVADGEVDILIGTQAVIQEGVAPPKLAMAVVDEQHRFGVMQRATLREKGLRPHLLAMSATPIPRSLYLTLYGDLDISVLGQKDENGNWVSEMPPGRQEIRTRLVPPDGREAAYELVRREAKMGRQAFVVCPLIQESETLQTRAATEEFEKLSREVFPDLRVGLLHGKLPLKEKESVMAAFQQREMDVLVATPVIEVGIDIPNATVMMIDGAERFGLSQLHQLRGRVGRGEHQSYCLLLSDSFGEEARERMRLVERTQDGFKLSEEDLRLRGPGDYIGTRQSGFLEFRVARLTDTDILAMARREASRLLDVDPELARPEHAALGAMLRGYTRAVADFS